MEFIEKVFAFPYFGSYPDKTYKRNSAYWGGTVPPCWMFYGINEGHNNHTLPATVGHSFWVREFIDLPVADVPPIGFIIDGTDGTTNHWVREPIIIESSAKSEPRADVHPPYDVPGTAYTWDYVGINGNFTFNNAIDLGSVLSTLLGSAACSNSIVSDFFQINPNNASSLNYVTGLDTKTAFIFLIQKSDAKHPEYSTSAITGNIKFNDLAKSLDSLFNVKNFIDENGKIRFEHISFFNKTVQLDLTIDRYKKNMVGMAKYSYNTANLPREEDYSTVDMNGLDFKGKPIIYLDQCTSIDSNNITHDCPGISTDMENVMSNDAVGDEGFLMIACAVYDNKFYVIQEQPIFGLADEMHHNNSLAFAQLHRDYQKYNRAFRHGILNDEYQEFISWQKTKKAATVSIPFCCNETFDPGQLVNGIFGEGKVAGAELKIRNETLDITLLHDSGEAAEPDGTTYLKLVLENQRPYYDAINGFLYENMIQADVAVYAFADSAGTIPKWINGLDYDLQFVQTRYYVPTPGTPYTVVDAPSVSTWHMHGLRDASSFGILSGDRISYTGTAPFDWKTSTWDYILLPSPDYTIIP